MEPIIPCLRRGIKFEEGLVVNDDSRNLGETEHSPYDQHHDHSVVFNVVPGPECVVPMIKQFRDMAPDADGQDRNGAEMKKSSPHVR